MCVSVKVRSGVLDFESKDILGKWGHSGESLHFFQGLFERNYQIIFSVVIINLLYI